MSSTSADGPRDDLPPSGGDPALGDGVPAAGDGTIRVAALAKRAAARGIDLVIFLGLVAVVLPLFVDAEDGVSDPRWVAPLIAGLMLFAYEAGFVAWRGQTPGKIALGIRIVDAAADGPVSPGQAARRWLVPGLALSVLGVLGVAIYAVVYSSAIWDRSQRGWHDRLSGTRVVPVG